MREVEPRGEVIPRGADDDGFASRAQKGDQEALSTLYHRYVAEIYRYAYRQVGNREDAEDLTSQIFLQMVRSIGGYQPQGYFRAWVYGIARNVIVDWWRRYYWTPTVTLEKFLELEPVSHADPPVANPRAEATVESLLLQLPERFREVLTLRFLRGYSLEETAQAMGVSLANAKVLQHRAMKKAAQLGLEG
ncbi:MAG: sigma-70 family RNA polymerase sigma factor [Dehalococcoidia bacterium]|nr:sigma-70 family RNA polymerase sigma factor [Dehalococcoidia bacterium]